MTPSRSKPLRKKKFGWVLCRLSAQPRPGVAPLLTNFHISRVAGAASCIVVHMIHSDITASGRETGEHTHLCPMASSTSQRAPETHIHTHPAGCRILR
jgi:hypothetical protein